MDIRRKPESLTPILGQAFVASLTDPQFAVLRIGRDTWTRHQVANQLGLVHTRACAILSGIAKELGVADTKDLYETTSPYTFADKPAGVTTMFVMFCAFRDRDLSVEHWYHKGQKDAIVSFLGLKHRELEAERRTKADAKRRRRAS